MGSRQARILEWVAMPFSRASSWPRDQTWVSPVAGRFFTIWASRDGQVSICVQRKKMRDRVILILCHPLLLLPSIFPSSRVFSNESTHHIRWPKNWSFSFSIIPSNLNTKCEYQKPSWQHISRFSWSQSLKKKDQHHVHSLVIRKFLTSLSFQSGNIWLPKKKKKKWRHSLGKNGKVWF